MIVNTYSVLMLFVAGLGLLLSVFLLVTAGWAAGRISVGSGPRSASAAERLVHLVRLVAISCLTLLVIGWPLFHAMLASFVPEVPGAMCIYGVTKVMPRTVAVIQTIGPAAIFALGAWLLLDHAFRQSGHPIRRSGSVLTLAGLAAIVAATFGAQSYYVLNMESLNEVSCCSSYGEVARAKLQAPSYYLPWASSGSARRIVLAALFFAGAPLLALWLLRTPASKTNGRRGLALAEHLALLAASGGFAFAALLAFSEVLASWLMRLPFHNCLYCLVTNGRVPESPLVLANLGMGILFAGWAAVLGMAQHMGLSVPVDMLRQIRVLGATALGAAVLMTAVHLAALSV